MNDLSQHSGMKMVLVAPWQQNQCLFLHVRHFFVTLNYTFKSRMALVSKWWQCGGFEAAYALQSL